MTIRSETIARLTWLGLIVAMPGLSYKSTAVVLTPAIWSMQGTNCPGGAPCPKEAKEARWEGMVIRSNPDASTLTVRKADSNVERTIKYDSSTQWVSQEHGSKKVNEIDAAQVKDSDRVICKGTWDKNGVLHATLISKRLTH